jgi:hypothetical protein
MRTYEYDSKASIQRVEFRQSVSGPEAVLFPSARPAPQVATLPDDLRKQGMSADPIVSGNSPALRVRGFESEAQIIGAIAEARLGTPSKSPAPEGPNQNTASEGKFARMVRDSQAQSNQIQR